jgi:RHS repeat-associated protein
MLRRGVYFQQKMKEPSGNFTTYSWDYENWNTRTVLPSAQIVTAVYHPEGLRVRKDTNSGTTKFIWDGENYLAETDGADATAAIYTNAPLQFGKLVSQRRGTTTSFFHFEALGSTRNLTASNQAASDSYIYSAFGEPVASTGSTVNPFRFIGELGYYSDSETANVYVRRRPLRPVLALWLTFDPATFPTPVFFASATGGDVTLYRYVRNRPVLLVDPSGLQTAAPRFYFVGGKSARDDIGGGAVTPTIAWASKARLMSL